MVDSIGTAEELEGMADSSLVELHSIGIETNRDGSILEEPLSHLSLVLSNLHPAADSGGHSRSVELAGLVLPVVPVVSLRFEAPDLEQSLKHKKRIIKSILYNVHRLTL